MAYHRQVERKSIKKSRNFNALPPLNHDATSTRIASASASKSQLQGPSTASTIIDQARNSVLSNLESLQRESSCLTASELHLRQQLHFRDAELAILRAVISGTTTTASFSSANQASGDKGNTLQIKLLEQRIRELEASLAAATNSSASAANSSVTSYKLRDDYGHGHLLDQLKQQLRQKEVECLESGIKADRCQAELVQVQQTMLAQVDDARKALRMASDEVDLLRKQSTSNMLKQVREKEVQAVADEEQNILQLQAQVTELQKQLNQVYQTHAQELETVKFQCEREMSDVARQHQELQKRYDYLVSEHDLIASENHGDAWARWHAERTGLKSQLDEAFTVTAVLQERIRSLISENIKLDNMVNDLSSENEVLKVIHGGKMPKIPHIVVDLETQLSNAQQKVASLTSANEALKSQLALAASQLSVFVNSSNEKEIIEDLEQDVTELGQQLEVTQLENMALKRRFEPLRKLQNELNLAQTRVAAFQGDVAEYSKVLSQAQESESNLKKEYDVLQMDYWKLSNERKWMSRAILNIDRLDLNNPKEDDLEDWDQEIPQIDVVLWIKGAISKIQEVSSQLADAHTILDMQHSRIEGLIMSSSNIKGSCDININCIDGHSEIRTKDSSVQTDFIRGFMRLSTVKAQLLSSKLSSHSLQQHCATDHERDVLARYSELQAKYETVQSDLSNTLQQLHDIKKLLIYSSASAISTISTKQNSSSWSELGIPNSISDALVVRRPTIPNLLQLEQSSLQESVSPQVLVSRYVDATIQVIEWKALADKYKRRCEEVEEVVESFLVGNSSNEDTLAENNAKRASSVNAWSVLSEDAQKDLPNERDAFVMRMHHHPNGLVVPCCRCHNRLALVL